MRPEFLVYVAGTGTEVGKTWFSAGLLGALRSECAVAARKPAQSFAPTDSSTDASILAAATGEQPDQVCLPHRNYETPMAPPMAAEVLGREPFSLADLVAELSWPPGLALGLVESAGGVASPIAADGDAADLARLVDPDVTVLVADAGLGTLNSVRLSVGHLDGLAVVVWLNRFDDDDDLHVRNRDWLRSHLGCPVETTMGAMVDRARAWCRQA